MAFYASANAESHTDFTQLDPVTVPIEKEEVSLLQGLHSRFAGKLDAYFKQEQVHAGASLISLGVVPSIRALVDGQTSNFLVFSAFAAEAGVIICSESLAKAFIEELLGEAVASESSGPLSGLERHLWINAVLPILEAYGREWDFAPFRPQPLMEHNPIADEPYFIANYDVQATNGSGQLLIALRLAAWTDALTKGTSLMKQEQSNFTANSSMLRAIGGCTVRAQALLGTTTIAVRDLLSLQPGDIICLDRKASAPIEIRIGARATLWGRVHIEPQQYTITLESSSAKGGLHGSK